jgi:hypothetical protein
MFLIPARIFSDFKTKIPAAAEVVAKLESAFQLFNFSITAPGIFAAQKSNLR